MSDSPHKIVYCTPALYMAGGVERVLTLKANYFAEHYGFDITIILTEGKEKPLFYPLSDKVKIINLDIGFEELWKCSFINKVFVYLKKQHRYKKQLTKELMRLRPDITVSLLRRDINFITNIQDGSKKIGELHVNRANYRNFEDGDSNVFKSIFAYFWMKQLVVHLKRLDQFVVLTEEDRKQWFELDNVVTIPDPLTLFPNCVSSLERKRVIAVGRYVYQKGFDLLLQAWSMIEKKFPYWQLVIFGDGDTNSYKEQIKLLNIDDSRCVLNGPSSNIFKEYINSSVFVFSSRFEGFGMVLVEAMACGLPVISYDCPCGPKDIISNNVDGLLVENGSVEKLALGLTQLMSDESIRKRFSAEARKSVERFKIEHIAEKWKSLFDNLYAV